MTATADAATRTVHVEGLVENLEGTATGDVASAQATISDNYRVPGSVQSVSGHFALDLTEAVSDIRLGRWAEVHVSFCIISGSSRSCELVRVAAPGPEHAPSGPCRVEADLVLAKDRPGAMKWVALSTSIIGFAQLTATPVGGSVPGQASFLAHGKTTMTAQTDVPATADEPRSTCSIVEPAQT